MTTPVRSSLVRVFSDAELWCFSFVTLFNLQGTRPVRHPRRNIHYLTTPGSVCQALFSTFFKIFFALALAHSGLLESLVILPHFPGFVNPFFLPAATFFQSRPPRRRPVGQLAQYTRSTALCQLFFLKILKFFLRPGGDIFLFP